MWWLRLANGEQPTANSFFYGPIFLKKPGFSSILPKIILHKRHHTKNQALPAVCGEGLVSDSMSAQYAYFLSVWCMSFGCATIKGCVLPRLQPQTPDL